ALVLAGLSTAAVAVGVVYQDDLPAHGLRAATWAWIILSYVFAGAVAWWRKPESRFGPLMVAAGFAAFGSAVLSSVGIPYTIGFPLRLLPVVLFLHLFLAYPSGRLERRFERVIVGTAYVATFGVGIVRIALGDTGEANLPDLATVPAIEDVVLRVQLLVISGAALAGVVVIFLTRRRSGRPLRRSIDLLIDAFGLGLVMIAVLLSTTAFNVPGREPIRAITFMIVGLAPAAFLVGVLRAQLARSAVAELVLELRRDLEPADLRDALARALRDPSLSLAFWLPHFGSYTDVDGRPVQLQASDEHRARTLIERDGARVAMLLHDPAVNDEPELLDAVTAAAGMALENGRLDAELRARVEELKGSRARIVEAGHRERKRLERNLHDGAQQRLISLSLELGMLQSAVTNDPEAVSRLVAARREIATSLEELRAVAHGIHPAVVSGHGLEIALEQLAVLAPVPVRLRVGAGSRLPEPLEVAAFYLVSESLANISKHACATSATVEVDRVDGQVVVEVIDDGIGGADTECGSGLRGLADRVEALEGQLRIWSPIGGGTRVRAEIPCG
ncbi:histidine kinase, partial [Aeromicrobium sp.]